MTALLGLVVFVRDDLDVLPGLLEGARAHVDAVALVDVRGLEGLPELASARLGGVPFVVLPPGARGAQRAPPTRFSMWLDPDELLVGGAPPSAQPVDAGGAPPDLRAALEQAPPGEDLALEIRGVARTVEYRVFPGPVDDVALALDYRLKTGALPRPSGPPLAGAHVLEPPEAEAPSKERRERRWKRDVARLERALRDDPDDATAASLLGVLYLRLGLGELALGALDRLARLGGSAGRFDVRLLQARAAALSRVTAWPELLERYLRLHAEEPLRPEPLFDLAVRCARERADGPALLFGERAHALEADARRLSEDEVRELEGVVAAARAGLARRRPG